MRFILLFCVCLLCCVSFAQTKTFVIEGVVTEAGTGQTIDYASVVIHEIGTQKILGGTTTEDGGKFQIESKTKDVYLEVSFIGYNPVKIDNIDFTNNKVTLPIIRLGTDAEVLEEVVVQAERSTTEFKLDKRVFNVGTDLSSSGAGALEVLNNVPSVNVSIEGEVSLRGSTGVQILINGKPSVLADDESNALGTITAEMIEKVEVITNPSAKYEAEGTAGIINIVLRKNEKKGLVGSVSINTGIPANHNIGFSLSKRTEKFNLFTQIGVGYKEQITNAESRITNLDTGRTTTSFGDESRNENYYNLILGTDYYINPLNIITLSGSFAYEIEDQPSNYNFARTDEITEALNPKFQYEFQYKKEFTDDKEHTLLFSAIGNFFGKDQSSVFDEFTVEGTGELSNQTTATNFQEGKYTFNLDYTKPFQENWSIETGLQYLDNTVSNDYTVSDEINGEFVVNKQLTNVFEYKQKVLGIYTTAAFENKVWGLKLGLRVENTDLNTLLVNTDIPNDQNFTNLFPSAHTSYKIAENVSIQMGYSRRIYRPRLWDLNPFFNIRNTFNIRTGNPDLQPEFTDSYELASIFIYDKVSFNTTVYQRNTTEVIERVLFFSGDTITRTPQNVGTRNATGVELNFKYTPIKKITFNGNMNYNFFKREGNFKEQDFNFTADQWTSKITGKYKISKSLDTEITAQYESAVQTIQGVNSANLFANFGMRLKLKGGKSVFSFSVRDIFASRFRENTFTQPDRESYTFRTRGRFITLGYSYGFGKGEAIEFKGGVRRR